MRKKLRFLFILLAAFTIIVPIGTLLHELGHYLVGIFYYYDVSIHRTYTTSGAYKFSTGEEEAAIITTLGGVVSTLLISLIGILLISAKNFTPISIQKFSIKDISKIILAYFVSRELILCFFILFEVTATNTDEFKIAQYLNLNPKIFAATILIVSFFICLYILHKAVIKNSQFLFLTGAVIGCGIGYFLWLFI